MHWYRMCALSHASAEADGVGNVPDEADLHKRMKHSWLEPVSCSKDILLPSCLVYY